MDRDALPSVIVMGGNSNAISVARSLGRRGLRVYVVNHAIEYVRYSRYCSFISLNDKAIPEKSWETYLLGNESDHLRGAVLLACSDDATEVIIRNREKLADKFILDIMNEEAQRCMLNKLSTYEAALSAGVPVPRFWRIENKKGLDDIIREAPFPLLIKPVHSHKFQKKYGRKFLLAGSEYDLRSCLDYIATYENEVILLEFIPGPDNQLCSYYTYIDEDGEPLFHFTKRVIRRFPINEGNACYHITDYVDDVRDLSLKLLRTVGLKGLANLEFKIDYRDGKLKLIECNARFTAANCLLEKSGIHLASFVYNRLVDIPQELPSSYKAGKRLWYPREDFKSFLELRSRGEITLGEWLKSIMHRQTLPFFAWDDPVPSLRMESKRMIEKLKRIWSKARRSLKLPQYTAKI